MEKLRHYLHRGRDFSSFRYGPLDPKKNEIRVLKLCKSKYPKGLVGNLIHISLEQPPAYNALSYMWGDLSNLQGICLGGSRFPVTENLMLALESLLSHQRSKHLVIWVDAICINQGDIEERNEQVRKMRRIYECASVVMVWLGEAADDSSEAFTLVHDLSQRQNTCKSNNAIFGDLSRVSSFRALELLLRREYWSRIWMIQEVNAAKRITVFCGLDLMDWDDLQLAQELIRIDHISLNKFISDNPVLKGLKDAILFEGPRSIFVPPSERESFTLQNALIWFKNKLATRPEDMVYGLLGLTTAYDDPEFIVDYSRGTRQVFVDVTLYSVAKTKDLTIIVGRQPLSKIYMLPSWCPDWYGGNHNTLCITTEGSVPFKSSQESFADIKFVEHERLFAKGFSIGAISLVGEGSEAPIPTNHGSIDLGFRDTLSNINSWRQLLGPVTTVGISQLFSFIRTIMTYGPDNRPGSPLVESGDDASLKFFLGLLALATTILLPSAVLGPTMTELQEQIERIIGAAEIRPSIDSWMSSLMRVLYQRHFIILTTETMGVAFWEAQIGDIICILLGCSIPVVLRRVEDHYIYVGEAYIDSYMYGKGMDELLEGKHQLQEFDIH